MILLGLFNLSIETIYYITTCHYTTTHCASLLLSIHTSIKDKSGWPVVHTLPFTVEPERRQWAWWNYIAFWIADSLNIVRMEDSHPGSQIFMYAIVWVLTHSPTEHLDDFVFDDCGWLVLVAIMDLRLDWISHRRRFCLLDRSHRCCLSHFLPSYSSSFIRNLGIILACHQSCGHGYNLVWCTGLHWRYTFPLSFVERTRVLTKQSHFY